MKFRGGSEGGLRPRFEIHPELISYGTSISMQLNAFVSGADIVSIIAVQSTKICTLYRIQRRKPSHCTTVKGPLITTNETQF